MDKIRQILIALWLVLLIHSCGITYERPVTYQGLNVENIDLDLRKYVREFRADAKRYGYSDERLLKGITKIQFRNMSPRIIAQYHFDSRVITINEYYRDNSFKIRWALYHEIGHHLRLPHLMSMGDDIMSRTAGYPGRTYSNQEWQDILKRYFKRDKP